MKCPYCNNDMKSGFIEPSGRGGLCWVSEKSGVWSAPRSDPDFLQLGKAPWLKAESVPAFNCETCKRIIVDYSALE